MKKQFQVSFGTDIKGIVFFDNHTNVPEPPMTKNIVIWASQALIPFSILGSTHAFLGPLPISSVKYNKLKDFFPCLPYWKPHAFEDNYFELGFME